MTSLKQAKTSQMPDRLVDAHTWLTQYYPSGSPSRQDWREWHELNARVFAHIAETDTGHHHEAVALAGIARRHAELVGTEAETGIRPPVRSGASHGLQEKGRGETDSTSV